MGGQKLKLDGGGKSVRVFIHMKDVSTATQAIAERGVIKKSGEQEYARDQLGLTGHHIADRVLNNLG